MRLPDDWAQPQLQPQRPPRRQPFGLGAAATSAATGPTYGTGTPLQNACPPFPPAPLGYVAWDTNVNGAIPAAVQAAATALANDLTKPLGYTQTVYSGGVPLLVRVDAHTWTSDTAGNPVGGCFHGADVFVPTPTVITSQPSGENSNGLIIASIALGAVVSVLTIWDFMRKK